MLGNGLDLVHVFVMLFAPGAASILLGITGPFYLAWFPLLGWDLLRALDHEADSHSRHDVRGASSERQTITANVRTVSGMTNRAITLLKSGSASCWVAASSK